MANTIGVRIEPDKATEKFRRAARVTDSEMRILLARIGIFGESAARTNTPRGATGALAGGYAVDGPKGTPGRWQVAVVNPIAYHDIRNKGRRPGRMPPPGALESWVGTKLGIPVEDRRSVAFLVARKIAREGYEGANMVEEAWDETRRRIRPELSRMGLKISRELRR